MRLYTGARASQHPKIETITINFTAPSHFFGAFFHACMTPSELSKLNMVLQQGWTEGRLADFAQSWPRLSEQQFRVDKWSFCQS
ncbi:bsl3895 [Bradyrhizobium diazoefficiens USDA 110]|uniref:Bsl3895 protein n=2 Tax=Bradyrhizobium diazoefficiens TaxID=1355477 RepID=Q89NE7_BRADU|nr:hypothetical protein AAV28_16490 [Bradyrhizobium diazoefficiens USDA 110]QBP22668.1 hypothetical protein Bdiaspc4_20155 [Bradyrhizobium diazoefficiens]BAC49160.1 bsl3895 [Bradyrhizobium diazoefficiens USDA 110]BCE21487.1 hypothetical protein XF1B_41680 [Bradyrhizobium diazoefficiens]BCE91254.1 hypothetical protein XF10B_40520 [Bradyrhizobium diazoefficiens]